VSRALRVAPAAPLTDGVVTLRPWRAEDLRAIVAICDDPEVARWTRVPSPYTEEDARAFLAGAVVEETGFAIVAAGDDEDVLGSIGVRDAGEGRAEIGYLVGARARRRGVATRAVRLLSDWCLGEARLGRVQIAVPLGNVASQATAERAGFRREGVLRGYLAATVGRDDAVIYGRVASAP
jgi:RimJ/RimL family protein N-acetyltransferase